MDAIFPSHKNHELDAAALTREVLRASQMQRTQQRFAQQTAEQTAEQAAEHAAERLVQQSPPAPVQLPVRLAEKPSEPEQELERPDWSVRFAGTPLNVMEEAARKSMARGAMRPPAWEDWRDDLRAAGKEMAAAWGKRDKNTRMAEAEVAPAASEKPRMSVTKLWDQE